MLCLLTRRITIVIGINYMFHESSEPQSPVLVSNNSSDVDGSTCCVCAMPTLINYDFFLKCPSYNFFSSLGII